MMFMTGLDSIELAYCHSWSTNKNPIYMLEAMN